MKKVYMSFSTDIIHSGHINIIRKAAELGELTVGALTDKVVASYKRYPLLSCEERMNILRGIIGVKDVVEQNSLSYATALRQLKPDFLVHGDDWQSGFQQPIREEAISVLAEWGGQLIEFPYSRERNIEELERHARSQLSIPDIRRGGLKKLLSIKPLVTAMEAHSGLTGLIVENSKVLEKDGAISQFDAIWISSLCDSTAKGKPDIELVDMTSRIRTIDDIMEVTTKPIIFDGDTGGQIEHFVYLVRTLERIGVSAIIVEDKTGLKRNSLFGDDVEQTQDSIDHFSQKLRAGKSAKKTRDMMIIARIESLILNQGMDDALNRAFAFTAAGADGIMIHSRRKDPAEIFEFIDKFRKQDNATPVVVVPTSFASVTEEEFSARGANLVIYANQLTRSAVPAMRKTAETILTHHRAQEADSLCMSFDDIIRLIPEE
jgi:phosphoenolpyruvate phosphomutase